MPKHSPSLSILLVLLQVASIAVQAVPRTAVLNNLVTLPIAKRFNFTGSGKMLQRDQARARNLRARAIARANGTVLPPSSQVGSDPIDSVLNTYIATVGIGTPPTSYNLIVDTGSANTWIGAKQSYVETPSSRPTRDTVAVDYGYGEFMSGVEFTDTVELSPGLSILGQSIGIALESTDFAPYDGVLGLGPSDLTVGSLTPDSTSSVPTVTENLYFQGIITSEMVSLSFVPATVGRIGELTFGGTDPDKFVGALTYAPITRTFPSSKYFGVDQVLRYGDFEILLNNNPGVFDVGTTLVLLATDAFLSYMSLVGGVYDEVTQLYSITFAQYDNLESMFFIINGAVFEFTANAQIWPRELNSAIGGSSDLLYLIIADIGTYSGSGMDIVNGMMFMERFYAVFDTQNNRVGVANSPSTWATSN
ncbi:aspartic proteinase precursor [Cubamyces lactineus]|nr:aspartic proteinase precursor [Cubamyces lactineus]